MTAVSIVSAHITIVAMDLRIASTFHASLGILFAEGGGNVIRCDDGGDLPPRGYYYPHAVMSFNIHMTTCLSNRLSSST
jgi:hypothetical protein